MGFSSSHGAIEHRVVVLLQLHGKLSRSDVARMTGLARSTITTAVNTLLNKGAIVELEQVRLAGRGRPRQLISLAPDAGHAIGIDFGFRHVRGVLADLSQTVLAEAEYELGSDYGVQDGTRAMKRLVAELANTAGVPADSLMGIGVGVPCPTSPDGVAGRAAMIPTWAGVRLQDLMRTELGDNVHVENESRMAARAEAIRGAARGIDDFIYLKLHSGVGGAIFVGGRCLTGVGGGAGELGHISLDPTGPICRCGNRGCLEAYVGIPALLSQLQTIHPGITFQRMLDLYEAQTPSVVTTINDAAERVGRAAGMLCNALNPSMIVLGGSLAGVGEPLRAIIKESVDRISIELNRNAEVRIGKLGRSASALGGVARAFQIFGRNKWST